MTSAYALGRPGAKWVVPLLSADAKIARKDTPRDWQLIVRYRHRECGKRHALGEWGQNPKCRHCGVALCPDDHPGESSATQGQRQLVFCPMQF